MRPSKLCFEKQERIMLWFNRFASWCVAGVMALAVFFIAILGLVQPGASSSWVWGAALCAAAFLFCAWKAWDVWQERPG